LSRGIHGFFRLAAGQRVARSPEVVCLQEVPTIEKTGKFPGICGKIVSLVKASARTSREKSS
jgi:hypothetical protein